MSSVRVRYAPSPTGYLHVGTARSALYTWLFARHHGGIFILRIEDTDRKRYIPDSLDDIMTSLRWLGLEWDEGPEVGGAVGPYFQSERLPIYQEYARQLVEQGQAYPCYCSPERLAAMRAEQRALKQSAGYDRHCRTLTATQRAEFEAQGLVPVVRLKVPLEGETTFHDVVYGDITFRNDTLDDLVLLKSDGYPTYHLANVIDDHLMGITHIMRADEWLSSVPKHILLYQAFGWQPPIFAHLPMILDPSGKGKMSKRKTVGPGGKEQFVLVRDFRKAGYLPEAMINYLALLGWSYDDHTELFSVEELISCFDIDRVKSSPAAFSYEKLEWMNGVYIRQLSQDDLADRLTPVLTSAGLSADRPTVYRLVPLVQERLKTLNDVVTLVDFLFTDEVQPDPADLIPRKMTAAETLAGLKAARSTLAALPNFDEETVERALRGLAGDLGLKVGPLFTPIRVAVTGKRVAPPLFGTLSILGQDRVLARMDKAIAALVNTR